METAAFLRSARGQPASGVDELLGAHDMRLLADLSEALPGSATESSSIGATSIQGGPPVGFGGRRGG